MRDTVADVHRRLVGLEPDQDVGREVLINLAEGNYSGELSAVNPHAELIGSVPSYPSVLDIPGTVDLVIVAAPAAQVLGVVRDCGRKGVAGAVILTAGFSELGEAGRQLQQDVLAAAREHSIRLIGPNCLGAANTAPEVRLNATFADLVPSPGSLAIPARSGTRCSITPAGPASASRSSSRWATRSMSVATICCCAGGASRAPT